jgi:metal-sulfur cluster biosynthetic enzyme/ribosomal protein L22
VSAGPALAAEWRVDDPQLRVTERDARMALRAVLGQPVIWARARLRFGPGRTCEPIARLLDRAIVRAEAAGLDPRLLVVADGHAQAGEDIVRVRRKAHGVADWIRSPTCQVRIVLRPAGLHASVPPAASGPAPAPAVSGPAPAPAAPSGPAASPGLAGPPGTLAPPGPEAAAVRDALAEVIDPDLGVGVVDLGFVRAVAVEDRTAVITMTLTSAACPLTGILEDQIRAVLAPLSCVDGFRVDWQWIPAWRPADITASGRDQLRAVGFTI